MILDLEQQVAPLALCRRLKELGAPQDAAFTWLEQGEYAGVIQSSAAVLEAIRVLGGDPSQWSVGYRGQTSQMCAAYTVAELGAMLPFMTDNNGRPHWLDGSKDGAGHWSACYSNHEDVTDVYATDPRLRGATEAEARAALLIALAERGVVKW